MLTQKVTKTIVLTFTPRKTHMELIKLNPLSEPQITKRHTSPRNRYRKRKVRHIVCEIVRLSNLPRCCTCEYPLILIYTLFTHSKIHPLYSISKLQLVWWKYSNFNQLSNLGIMQNSTQLPTNKISNRLGLLFRWQFESCSIYKTVGRDHLVGQYLKLLANIGYWTLKSSLVSSFWIPIRWG